MGIQQINMITTVSQFPLDMLFPIEMEIAKPVFKPKRRVQFFEARVVSFLEPCSSMSLDERRQVWYQAKDLEEFKRQARTLCRRLRTSPIVDEETARGLEHRICFERQKNKVLALRCILKAQRRLAHHEQVAMVARKCTAWAKEVAIVEATRDFCEAYHPHLTALVHDVSCSSDFPFALKKREVQTQQTERRVRSRTDTVYQRPCKEETRSAIVETTLVSTIF
jgi:hypothetical protein